MCQSLRQLDSFVLSIKTEVIMLLENGRTPQYHTCSPDNYCCSTFWFGNKLSRIRVCLLSSGSIPVPDLAHIGFRIPALAKPQMIQSTIHFSSMVLTSPVILLDASCAETIQIPLAESQPRHYCIMRRILQPAHSICTRSGASSRCRYIRRLYGWESGTLA